MSSALSNQCHSIIIIIIYESFIVLYFIFNVNTEQSVTRKSLLVELGTGCYTICMGVTGLDSETTFARTKAKDSIPGFLIRPCSCATCGISSVQTADDVREVPASVETSCLAVMYRTPMVA